MSENYDDETVVASLMKAFMYSPDLDMDSEGYDGELADQSADEPVQSHELPKETTAAIEAHQNEIKDPVRQMR